MIWVLIIIFSCYFFLILSFAIGFKRIALFTSDETLSNTKFSIIIPFRNEAKNLPNLLASISKIEYPKNQFEIIFVDDESDDNSVEIIQKVLDTISHKSEITRTDICVIKNNRVSSSPKKDAITTAIKKAKFDWILTTDADCILPKKWLKTINDFIQKEHPKMVVAPVNYNVQNSFLHRFQLLDFLSMQGSTIGGFGINFPFMCNGANLAYKKEDFIKLNGFVGNNNMASGDDVFLFEKFLKSDKKAVRFLKSNEAIVTTFPVNSWKELVDQRVRWASKTSNFKSVNVKLIGLLVLLVNLSLIFNLFGFLFSYFSFETPLVLFSVKLFTDLILFIPTVNFYKQKRNFYRSYLVSSLVYPFFSIWVIFKSIFFKFTWKGRSFKK